MRSAWGEVAALPEVAIGEEVLAFRAVPMEPQQVGLSPPAEEAEKSTATDVRDEEFEDDSDADSDEDDEGNVEGDEGVSSSTVLMIICAS